MTNDPTHQATAAAAIACGMEAAADAGVPDVVTANELVKIALGLIGAANGGPAGVPDALRRLANAIEARPQVPVTLQ